MYGDRRDEIFDAEASTQAESWEPAVNGAFYWARMHRSSSASRGLRLLTCAGYRHSTAVVIAKPITSGTRTTVKAQALPGSVTSALWGFPSIRVLLCASSETDEANDVSESDQHIGTDEQTSGFDQAFTYVVFFCG